MELREKCLEEIVVSEENYVKSLDTLFQHYLRPLREAGILSEQDINAIFSNIEIIHNLNTELLSQLEERKNDSEKELLIGDIFLRMGPMLRMYRDYCKNFNTSLDTLKACSSNHKWTEYLQYANQLLLNKEKVNEQSMQYTLSSLLIMPVQRIPRYVLLLSELIKLTDPSHPDYENLVKSQKLIKDIASSLNEFIKDAEKRNQVLNISNILVGMKQSLLEPHRRFVKHGVLKKITSRVVQNCYLFLFNDILVYSHRQILSNFQYNGTILLGPCWIRHLEDTEKVKNVFQIVGPSKTWTFYGESNDMKLEWTRALEAVVNELVAQNPVFISQRATPTVRQQNLISLTFSPEEYDGSIRKPEKKNNRKTVLPHDVSSSSLNEDENAPLIKKQTPQKEKKSGCCTIV